MLENASPNASTNYLLWKLTNNLKRQVIPKAPIRNPAGGWCGSSQEKANIFESSSNGMREMASYTKQQAYLQRSKPKREFGTRMEGNERNMSLETTGGRPITTFRGRHCKTTPVAANNINIAAAGIEAGKGH
ncbi:GD17682 [Drosophila simulans]|uniref:GD17682 n=1 Tax=Drosophila simulans TaxID=7240 RepID=B4NSS4_DROSI|nr:GD17682 [Drosophila simulans]